MPSTSTQVTTVYATTQNCAQQKAPPEIESRRRRRSRQLARNPANGFLTIAGVEGTRSSSHHGRPRCSMVMTANSRHALNASAQLAAQFADQQQCSQQARAHDADLVADQRGIDAVIACH